MNISQYSAHPIQNYTSYQYCLVFFNAMMLYTVEGAACGIMELGGERARVNSIERCFPSLYTIYTIYYMYNITDDI